MAGRRGIFPIFRSFRSFCLIAKLHPLSVWNAHVLFSFRPRRAGTMQLQSIPEVPICPFPPSRARRSVYDEIRDTAGNDQPYFTRLNMFFFLQYLHRNKVSDLIVGYRCQLRVLRVSCVKIGVVVFFHHRSSFRLTDVTDRQLQQRSLGGEKSHLM